MIRVCVCDSPLVISSVPPPRSTIATSSEPDSSSTARNPSLIEKMPISTATTPAMPTTATIDVALRSVRLRRFMAVTASVCLNQDMKRGSVGGSGPPQLIHDLEAPHLQARQRARQEAEADGEHAARDERVRRRRHQWNELL